MELGDIPRPIPSTVPSPATDRFWNLLRSKELIGVFIGLLFLVAAPALHLGFFFTFWVDKKPIDPFTCKCGCWDTIFKGSYESVGSAGYHHVYFNVTHQTLKIWTVTMIYVVAAYETCKLIVKLVFQGRLRLMMLLPLLGSIFPHYYSWWSYFNYWNDDFYFQWNHQLFFSITELISTVVVLWMCDAKTPLNHHALLFVLDIAVVHVITASGDQFWRNIIRNRGMWHQRVRDIGFMIPDLINVLVPLWCLISMARGRRTSLLNLLNHHYGLGLSALLVTFLCLLCWIL